MRIQQLKMHGKIDNFTYLVICEKTKSAAIIDPGSISFDVISKYRRIAQYLKRNYTLKYIINTHRHSDHTMGNRYFQSKFGIPVLSYINGLREGDSIAIGEVDLRVIETPGHTADSISFYSDKQLFTGDTLFVGYSGSTTHSDSDREQLGATLRGLITRFPPNTIVWSGHNFGKRRVSTLGQERVSNMNRHEYQLESVEYGGDYEENL